MTNTVGITEVTLAQIGDSTHNVNSLTHATGRGGNPLQSRVVRVTDHSDNVVAEVGADTDRMALFHSKAYGHPWEKYAGSGDDITVRVGADPTSPATSTSATVIYPNYKYVQDVVDGVGQANGIFDGTS